MEIEEFIKYWQQHYGKCLPIGYILRDNFKDRWFRIHTLPNSKRYPETETEVEIILHRHNILLTELLGANGHYMLITTGYSETANPIFSYHLLNKLICDRKHCFSVDMDALAHSGIGYWHFFISERRWQVDTINPILKLVANDEVGNILFVGIEKPFIYHPYDGGADIIMETTLAKENFKKQYSNWLSQRSDGL